MIVSRWDLKANTFSLMTDACVAAMVRIKTRAESPATNPMPGLPDWLRCGSFRLYVAASGLMGD